MTHKVKIDGDDPAKVLTAAGRGPASRNTEGRVGRTTMTRFLWGFALAAAMAIGLLAACSSDPPGLEACNYFRDDYLSLDAFWGITLAEEPSLSLVRDEAERLNQLARDAEPEIGDATGALLESVNQQNEPYGDTHMDIQNGVMGACMNLGYWEERPPPN